MSTTLLLRAGLPMLVFAGFIILTLRVAPGDTPATSSRLRMLIAYVVAVSMFAGLAGKNLWPFAAWRYVSYTVGESSNFLRLVGVDASGREHQLDTRAFEPLEFGELMGHLDGIEGMSQTHLSELLEFLLKRAQEGLAQAHAGRRVGTFSRLLGPLSAPIFHVKATPWADRDNLPRELEALRVYRVYWRVSDSSVHIERQFLAGTRS